MVAMFHRLVAGLSPVAAQIAANAGVDLPAILARERDSQNPPVALMEKSSA